jgi:glycine/D-amino acid oxidase-like deaminating enzyme/nitrite reductase/ring-hydroxylating ferredoxin subunit
MSSASGRSTSVWTASGGLPARSPLARDLTADVCVVGAGMAGLSTAYFLARAGRRVVVLDDGPVAGGETSRTTAHLASALDDRFEEIERLHGADGARLAAQSHAAAIDAIEAVVREEKIDCGFERLDGYLFAPPGVEREQLDKELEAARKVGLDVEMVDRAPVPLLDTGPAIRFAGQGQFHPLRYLAALVEAIERHGGEIHCDTHVTKVDAGPPARVETSGGLAVTAGSVVVATNSPVVDRVAIHTKQAAYRTFVIAARVPPGSVPRALYWDLCQGGGTSCSGGDPYHYVRLTSGMEPELLIAGAEDHKTGQADDADERFTRLEAWTRERFPITGVELRWSGQVMEPVDSLAFIGKNPGEENIYVATGDSGHGMTHGTIAGLLLTALITRGSHPWEELYDPSRKRLGAAASFAKENLNVAAQYAGWVTPAERDSTAELAPGEGAIVRRGLSKVAAYRDEEGVLHESSAVCVHLGCVVQWNTFERSWDCPCHGSRFDGKGRVLNGPANVDLSPAVASEPEPAGTRRG